MHDPASGTRLHIETSLADALHDGGMPSVGGQRAPDGALSAPTEVHLAVTERCPARCTTCYLNAGPERQPPEPDAGVLIQQLDDAADMGVFEVAFGGGEALSRPDLLRLLTHARSRGLVPNVTTSGFGLTPALARSLKPLVGQINVSIDGLGDVYTRVRGWDGADLGLRALGILQDAGVPAGVNTVLSRPLLGSDDALSELGHAIVEAGATEWQWLRLKPVGRGGGAYGMLRPTNAQTTALWPRALSLERELGLGLRFDCALVPFLVQHNIPVPTLARLGIRGCPGGHSLWARHADGGQSPCSFVPSSSAGDVPLATAWQHDTVAQSWRARSAAPPAPCNTCDARDVCRGGCRAVSAFSTGDPLAPDPECPRVQAWAAR